MRSARALLRALLSVASSLAAVVGVLATGCSNDSTTPGTDPEDVVAVIEAYEAAFISGDLESMQSIHHPDFQYRVGLLCENELSCAEAYPMDYAEEIALLGQMMGATTTDSSLTVIQRYLSIFVIRTDLSDPRLPRASVQFDISVRLADSRQVGGTPHLELTFRRDSERRLRLADIYEASAFRSTGICWAASRCGWYESSGR